MQKVIQVSLSGQPVMFRLDEAAYEALSRYLDRARMNLKADPDHEEVLRDLEQSIGEKLATRVGTSEQVIGVGEVNAVLAEIGPVEGSSAEPVAPHTLPAGRRRLVRIQEGQQIMGVSTGLAAYSKVDVDWVRTIFVMLTLVTGGAFGLVYMAMGFLLPIVATRADYEAQQYAAAPTR